MGGFFNFSFLDVWNNPITRVLRWGGKRAIQGVASANAKAENEEITTSELAEITNAAKNGNSDAQLGLALYYADKQNSQEFTYWLTKSAEQGNEHALQLIDMLQE